MTDKTLGAYKRTTPDPDETTGEALARLQAEMTRLLDEADAELRDEADGGVTAALIEKEVEQPDAEVRELRSALARELARGNALQDALDAAQPRPLTPDDITDEMVKRGVEKFRSLPTGMSAHARVSVILTAALTEPTRPEGAEELHQVLDAVYRDEPGITHRGNLADVLASHGVRVVTEEQP